MARNKKPSKANKRAGNQPETADSAAIEPPASRATVRRRRRADVAASPTCPVVGIGASAGGLEAFSDLLRQLPANTQLALVFISHLDPDHKSMLAELLKSQTSRPVIQVAGDMPVQCNHVYIIPPNRQMVISGRVLKLSPLAEGRERFLPVDTFFRSLAEYQKSNAIGVVLSGNASDGTLALERIKAEAGSPCAQHTSPT